MSIGRSVLGFDLSPHCIDFDNCLYCFAPDKSTSITKGVASSLEFSLQSFSIKEFTLNRCRFNHKEINKFCDWIKDQHSLNSIDMSHCEISDDDPVHILNSISGLTVLKFLKMIKYSIGTKGAITLSELLKNNSTIVLIHLQHNSVFNEGAIAISESLKVNSLITEVILRGNPVDPATKQSFSRISNNRIKWSFW
ncbi:hypothetical protein GEMRC1_013002 [Eukaryota sp. GEM-RC1]